jgi:hypothetical protein
VCLAGGEAGSTMTIACNCGIFSFVGNFVILEIKSRFALLNFGGGSYFIERNEEGVRYAGRKGENRA